MYQMLKTNVANFKIFLFFMTWSKNCADQSEPFTECIEIHWVSCINKIQRTTQTPSNSIRIHGEKQKDQSFKERDHQVRQKKTTLLGQLFGLFLFLVVQHYGLWHAFHEMWLYQHIN